MLIRHSPYRGRATVVTMRHGPFLPDPGRVEAVVIEQDGRVSVIGSTPTARDLRERAPAPAARGGLADLLHGFDYHQLAWS